MKLKNQQILSMEKLLDAARSPEEGRQRILTYNV